jgi:hypothetical protein
MPGNVEAGATESIFVLNEKRIEKLVRLSLDSGERLIAVHYDRRPPAGETWQKYGTAYCDRYIEAEIEVPAFDYDAAPELGEKTIITMRGYAGLHLNGLASPGDIRSAPRDYEAGVEAFAVLEWL